MKPIAIVKNLAVLIILVTAVYALSQYHQKPSIIETTKAEIDTAAIARCQSLETPNKIQCFESIIDTSLRGNGVELAFDTLDHLYKTDADFAEDCHSFTHKLGTKAYELFASNKDFVLSTKSSYCGYGFYHGFMETLLQTTGSAKQAQEFCKYAGIKLAKATTDAEGACYHGIGHGAVDGSDPRAYGDAEKILKPGMDLCEIISENDEMKLFRCVTGAFNALEIFMSQNQHGLSVNKSDPFEICSKQPKRHQKSCYTQMTVVLMNVTGNDYDKMIKIIDRIQDDESALPTLEAVVVEKARIGLSDYTPAINYCRSIPSRFYKICINSIAEGFLKYGPPQQEYVGALNFCKSPILYENERKECYIYTLSMLRIWYTVEKSTEICKSVEPKYQTTCQYY